MHCMHSEHRIDIRLPNLNSQSVPFGFPLAIPLPLEVPRPALPLFSFIWFSPPPCFLSSALGRAIVAGVANLVGIR